MRFEYPQLLWLLPVFMAGLSVFFWWAWRTRQRILAQFIPARLKPVLAASVSPGRKKMKLFLLGCALVLVWTVLARPQWGFTWEEARSYGLDLVVAIDTSKSMLASDLPPSRLKRAQLAALDLRKIAAADRLGLVAFAGGSFLQCPLSLDDEAFRQSVEILDVNIIPQGGTALSEAILCAEGAFKDKADNHKVLIIFTDGEDNDGGAVEAARNAAKNGLLIFTIGVGTPNGEMIRLTDVQGRVEFLKDDDGNAVKSRLNEDLLRQVAEATGGFYMQLSGANTMNKLYENGLSRLPKSDRASQRVRRYHERYQWLLAIATVLLLAEMFLSERKSSRPSVPSAAESPVALGTEKPPVSTATVVTALMAIFLLFSTATADASNRKGLKYYQAGRYADAIIEYEESLKEKGEDPRVHFNIAAAAFQTGQYERAQNHLKSALFTTDVSLQQRIYYNLGNTQFRLAEKMDDFVSRQTQWEEAAKSYRNALALQTNDVDTVFNLQVVERKLAELKEWVRRRELAKKEAENAHKRYEYNRATQIMETEKARNPSARTKDIDTYIERLKQIDEIAPHRP
jgi:Ca-activated chloride channel family protein